VTTYERSSQLSMPTQVIFFVHEWILMRLDVKAGYIFISKEITYMIQEEKEEERK
jgi:hypothetical protein